MFSPSVYLQRHQYPTWHRSLCTSHITWNALLEKTKIYFHSNYGHNSARYRICHPKQKTIALHNPNYNVEWRILGYRNVNKVTIWLKFDDIYDTIYPITTRIKWHFMTILFHPDIYYFLYQFPYCLNRNRSRFCCCEWNRNESILKNLKCFFFSQMEN